MERELINDFLNAKTTREVDELVWKYSKLLDKYPWLYTFPKNARRRIKNLRRIKIQMTETIYLN